MTLIEKARRLRYYIEKASVSLSDEDAIEASELFPAWSPDKVYSVGDRVRDNGTLYKRIQPQVAPELYSPSDTPALWVEVAAPGEYREIKDNMLPTEAFELDEIGWYGEKTNLYRSKIQSNIYTPVTYPDGWDKL